MANPEHVEILLAGADAVRQWRDENPEGFLDLREANLANTNLHTVDLRQVSEFGLPQLNCTADFTGANLSGAAIIAGSLAGSRMCGASFSNATFQSADLASTNLQHADFTGASIAISRFTDARLNIANFQSSELFAVDFGRSVGGFSAHSGADLSGVNFSIATLMNCSFNGSKLTETNFTNATMYGVQFADTDLSTANGLDSLRFSGPSGIDIETLFRSRNLPDSFLRGCGVPEDLITYLSSLTGAAFDFYSCFISHSSRNDEFARRLHARMQQEKLRVWFAPEDMRGGRKSGDQIDSAIRLHDKLLLVLSQQSMRSEWVKREIRKAREAERQHGQQKLFPIRLCSWKAIREWECLDSDTGEDLAAVVREYHIPDFSKWKKHDSFEKAFAELLRDLRDSEE